ncbi:MAG: TetR/AcrR family transcriptional regulator [Firmicutes bacterium]|nr:TetR/AcrR family transcriptional regulator [Bacillota bacterium]
MKMNFCSTVFAEEGKIIMGGKTNRERERILAKARDLFFSYGYSKITMDELAAELKMSKKTIYNIFASKRDLLDEVIKNHFKDIKEEIETQLKREMSFQEMLKRLLLIINQKTSLINIRALDDIKKNSPDSWKMINKYRESFLQTRLKEIFQKGIREGVIKEGIPLELIVLVTMNLIRNITPPELMALPYSFDQVLEMIIEIIIEGIIVREE